MVLQFVRDVCNRFFEISIQSGEQCIDRIAKIVVFDEGVKG